MNIGFQIQPGEDGIDPQWPTPDCSPTILVEDFLEHLNYHAAGQPVLAKAAEIVRASRQ